MKKKCLITHALFCLITLSSSITFAEDVLCPSPTLIRNLWRNTNSISAFYADSGSNLFYVYNWDNVYDETNKLWWHVNAMVFDAPDFNTAYSWGRESIKTIANNDGKYAQKMDDVYRCGYTFDGGKATYIDAWGHQASKHQSIEKIMMKSHRQS